MIWELTRRHRSAKSISVCKPTGEGDWKHISGVPGFYSPASLILLTSPGRVDIQSRHLSQARRCRLRHESKIADVSEPGGVRVAHLGLYADVDGKAACGGALLSYVGIAANHGSSGDDTSLRKSMFLMYSRGAICVLSIFGLPGVSEHHFGFLNSSLEPSEIILVIIYSPAMHTHIYTGTHPPPAPPIRGI